MSRQALFALDVGVLCVLLWLSVLRDSPVSRCAWRGLAIVTRAGSAIPRMLSEGVLSGVCSSVRMLVSVFGGAAGSVWLACDR